MPEVVKPVGKITPITEAPETVKPVGKITVVGEVPVTKAGFDPLKLSAQEQKMKAVGEVVDNLDFSGGYNDDEKKYLIGLAKNPNVDYDTWNNAKLTVGGEHPKQEGQQYYFFDDNGLPVPLSSNERPPKGKQIESIWGSQSAADDDSIMTTIGKNLANTIPNFIQSFGDLIHLPYGIVAGKEADWYKDLKNNTEIQTARTSTASQQSFLDTGNVHAFDDLAKPENWHFTPQNIAGNASQLISTVLQFLGGAEIAKGLGMGAKAAGLIEAGEEVGVGTKALAKMPYLASSYMNNLSTSLDASEAAGITGRDKYAIASMVTLPVAAVESFMGLTGKIAQNPAYKAERDKLIQSLIKGWKEESGELTKESLKELYDNTIVASTSVLGKVAKEAAKDAVGEASEEVMQSVLQKSSEAIYDHLVAQDKEVGKGKYGTSVASPEAFAEYINDAIAGALGGGIGGAGVDKFRRSKAELQSENAYEYVKQGPEAVQTVKTAISRAADNGSITPEQKKTAFFKIDTYQKYYDQVKDLNLDDKSNRRIFDLTWSNENLKLQQEQLASNPESKIKGTIPHRRLLDTEAILEANSKEMSELMAHKIADQQTAVASSVDEKLAENKKGVQKDRSEVPNVVEIKEQIKAAETEKDLNALLSESDKKGLTNPEIIDEVGKRREQIRAVVTPPVQSNVNPEHADLLSKAEAAKPGKDFNNLLDWDQQDKSELLAKHIYDKGDRVINDGVLELGLWANKVQNRKKLPLYYDVDFSGKRFKIASSDYTNSIKEKNLQGRGVSVQLITPSDDDLDQMVKDGVLDPHSVVTRTDKEGQTSKFFVFSDDEHKQRYPYVLVARLQTKSGKPGMKIGNLATNTFSKFTATPEGKEGLRRPKKEQVQSGVTETQLAPEKTGSSTFDKSTAEPDYEAQFNQAEEVTTDEEDEGFTPVIEYEAKSTGKDGFVENQVRAQIDDGDFEEGSPVEALSRKLWAARWDKLNEKQTQKDEQSEEQQPAKEKDNTRTKDKGDTKDSEGVKKEKVKVLRPGNRVPKHKRKIKNPLAIKALKLEPNNPYETVLQYFIRGGQIKSSAIDELFGGAGKSTANEKKARISILSPNGMGIKELAHNLWENRQEGDERYDDSDYREAVEDVIIGHNGTRSMINEILNTHEVKDNQYGDDEQFYITPIDPSFIDDALDIWNSLSPEEQEYLANETNIPDSFWDNFEATDDDIQRQKTNRYKELESLIEKEEKELSAATKAFETKRKELDSKIVEDQEDLFGERKSSGKNIGMFDERVDTSARDKVVEPFKIRVEKSKAELSKLRKQLQEEEGKEDLTLFQKRSEMLPETKELRAKKIELLKKALPGIKVVEDDSIGDDVAGQLDADGKTVRLNPNYNFQDTPIHEFGHAIIDIMGGVSNSVIKKGVDQLKGTKLWQKTKANYPELSDEMLAKEVLAEAIGREGASIFDAKEKQSKFKNWLDGIFYKIKRLLGIDKNVARQLANQLLSGKRITTKTEKTDEVQKQKNAEEKTLLSVRPAPYKKWLKAQNIDEFEMKERIAELKEKIADADGDEKIVLEGELELSENSLENNKQAYQDYVDDHKSIQEFIRSKGDVSELSLDELYEIQNQMTKYDDLVKTKLYKDLLYNIGVKINLLQTEKLKAANPDYNPEEEQKGDLSKSDIWAQGLSTIGEKFPAVQAFYKQYRSAAGEMKNELNSIRQKGHELARAVITEYNKKHGITERLKNFTIGGGNKYFSFMAKDGHLVEKGSSEYNKLSKAQKDLLDFITEKKAGMDQYMDTDSNVLLKSGAGFIETLGKSGLYKAYANYITNNHNLRNVKVLFKDPETGKSSDQYFGDIENILQEYSKKGVAKKAHAMGLITKYNLAARKGLAESKGSKGKYFLRPDGKLVSMFGGEFKGDFTENYYETFMKYAQDATFSKHMSPLMPTLTGVEMLYKSMGTDKENVSKFLDVVKRGKFLGETIESGLGEKGDKALRVLRKWTSWRFIAFNIPANIWNIAVGEYNQFRADGGEEYLRGKKRFFASMVKGKNNAKAFNILKNYNPDLVTDIDNIDPEKHVGRYFDMLAFGGQKLGEGLIRGSAIIGKISKEHYEWFDSKGNLKGTDEEKENREKIIKAEIAKYISEVERVQGRYSDVEKRNFAYFELGQFFGQFKVWMPEWMSDRFANTYIDADGVKRKGSFRTLWGYGMRDFLRDARTKEFYTGTDPKHVAARKQLRGMIITGVLLSAYLSASDDDEDKDLANQLDKALRNISSIYRMDNNTFLISQPAAAMSVVTDLSKVLNAAISGQKYKSGDNEGDYKALDMAYNLIPANKIVSTPMELLSDE